MQTNKEYLSSLLYLACAFIFAYCLQITIHELGHAAAGWISGARGAEIVLHPFLNSMVTFKHVPSVSSQVFIGVMGSVVDLVLASGFAWFALWKTNRFSLPLILWGAIAFIGEGIGMLGNIAALPYSYDDIGQLMHLGISPKPLIPFCILMIVFGLVLMILATPLSGVSPKAPFLKKLAAYFCFLPFYFSMAVAYLLLFDPQNVNDLEIRLRQLVIGIVFSFLLTVLYAPLNRLLGTRVKQMEVRQPTKAMVYILLGSSLGFFAVLLLIQP